ncbi:BREX-1 system adenine-specific DNA-methyltransferase PglX [Shewanella sp. SM72]|uniref:BREX-1 system adenine-specific DNA-methyltransferase PglX n=1 Tax=Shewanella sp. SM72 TaxID=2912805 RepID=UPI0021DB4C10|nr:BREX-1 system adenine-specific DNA-methyltransferase PglX [Shewanella sp. SM72]MCU8019660.1 BREX-1 system adenine-specific DNA-methyltransferase PglX [Shewanella sp. SM72]
MKLAEHVDHLRELIEAAFDKQFARLGFSKTKQMDAEQVQRLPEEVQSKRQRFVAMLENHIGETGSYESAREKLLDELTFTLFNRLAAIKVMEAASLFPPILTKQKEQGDRSFGHKAWLEGHPEMRERELEGIRDYLKAAFDELGTSLPLYSKNYPYSMLPDAISLNDIIDAFNAVEQDEQIIKSYETGIWHSDDVLGWMYESYNNNKKQAHKVSKAKTEYDKVSLQSQVYTPCWVVQFLVENSLGKMYLEMYPNSEIKQRYKIANAPTAQTRKPKPLHEIKTIDPACGSGNFLLYAFDFYYALYQDQIDNYGADYDEKDIPKLIIENNLHGIDLDDRAVQLAQLGLFIKAKKKRHPGELKFRVVSSDFYLPEYHEVKHIFEHGNYVSHDQRTFIEKVWADLRYAYKFGSLIHLDKELKEQLSQVKELALGETFDATAKLNKKIVEGDLFAAADYAEHKAFAENFFSNLFAAVEQYARTGSNTFLTSKTRDAITFLELLTTEYDVATANPPYTDSADFGPELKEFIENNYKKPFGFHTNLYATFIKRCCELTSEDGKVAMIHPHTFMFIKTFEDVRKFMIDKCHIDVMVDFGLDRVNLFGPGILLDATFYVLSKGSSDTKGLYFNLTNKLQEKFKKDKFLEALNDHISHKHNERLYSLAQEKLKVIKSWPFIYWISDDFRTKFGSDSLDAFFNIKNGLQTGNNNRYLRFWWEIAANQSEYLDNKKWVLYCKGGPFNKWFGNLWTTVNTFDTNSNSSSKGYLKEGVNFSGSSSKGACFRFVPEGNMFDNDAPLIFPKKKQSVNYVLGFINSKLVAYIIGCLNPTVKTQVGDIKRIPFTSPSTDVDKYVAELTDKNVKIKQQLCKSSLVELNYEPTNRATKDRQKNYFNHENHQLTHVLINEAIINEKIFEIYNLTAQDKAMVLATEGESIGGLPVMSEARSAYLAETEATKEFPMDTILEFIESLPTKEFTVEEQDAIQSGFENLYQSNNSLEEFCIRHQVNPVNVWYWFKQSKVIPKQRMQTLAMEFLADMIREILMEDADGIIPLVPNSGENVLLDRIEEKFIQKGFNTAQYSSFDSVLGRPINDYLNKQFFAELSDHLNLFMYLPKTPFIWHLSSGLEQGFDCYIIIYKWSRDKLMQLRSQYIENRERSLVNRQTDLQGKPQLTAKEQSELDTIFKQLKEIESFKIKIDELLAEGYNPVLDDGVGKNIAPLQKKKMLAYDVLNPGQLKTYLNAEW